MNEKTLRALVEAGAVRRVQLVADGATIHVDVVTRNGAVTATTSRGRVKTWATIDAAAKWVKGLGVGRAQIEFSRWQPGQRGLPI